MGASQPFVSTTFAKISIIHVKAMQEKIFVVLQNREIVFYIKMVANYPLEISRVIMKADLIVLNLLGFDVILGMDYLFRNFTSINCRQWTVTFQMFGMEDKVF